MPPIPTDRTPEPMNLASAPHEGAGVPRRLETRERAGDNMALAAAVPGE